MNRDKTCEADVMNTGTEVDSRLQRRGDEYLNERSSVIFNEMVGDREKVTAG